MMKRLVLVAVLISLVSLPVFSQLRLDIGVDVWRGIGAMMGGETAISQETVDFFNKFFIPFPEAALHYQFDLGTVKLGLGARAFTLILESAIWPNAFAEANLGPIAIEAQVGGGIFALVGLYNGVKTGKVFFPDLSVWYKIGKKQAFRVGVGAMGFFLPDMGTDVLPFVFYLGAKAALDI